MKYKKINGYTILNEPTSYKLGDYYEVRDKVVNIFKKIPYLTSIYQMGSISCPGISDLDLILVFNDSVRNISYKQYYNRMDQRTRDILMHSPFAVTESLFNYMKYFYVPQNFELLFGEKQSMKNVPVSDFLDRVVSIEFVLGLLFTTMQACHHMVVKVRSLMNGLYSIKHDLAVFGMTKKDSQTVWRYIQALSALRNNWFGFSGNSALDIFTETVNESSEILVDLLRLFNRNIEINYNWRRDKIHYKIKLGVNNWIVNGTRLKHNYDNREMYFLPLLKYLPFSNHVYDVKCIFSDYFVKLPDKLLSLFSVHNSGIEPEILAQKNMLTRKYIVNAKRFPGFSLLLPPIKSSSVMNSIKWRILLATRQFLKHVE